VATSPQNTTKEAPPEEDKASPNASPDDATRRTWHFKDNSPCDRASIKEILSILSSLECNAYSMGDDKKVLANETPVCHITFTGEEEMTFTLFEKNSDGKYPSLSSTTPFPFVLDDYSGKNILSSVETLLSIEKKETSTQEQ